jgi:hypothetical protein
VLADASHRTRLETRARARAREFSWERFAAITLQTLDAVAAQQGIRGPRARAERQT